MEAFSLLKYWRTTTTGLTKSTSTPTITTSSPPSSTSSSDNDHGPYFDMEFALADEKEQTALDPNAIDGLAQENETEEEEDEEEEEEEVEVSLRISSSSSSNDSSKEHSHSKIYENVDNSAPIETSSLIVTSSDSTHKFSNNLLKSASKFRVLMALKLKKLKENAAEEGKKEGDKPETENNNNNNPTEKETHKRKFFTVKFIKVDEVPIVSLFTRDHSSKTENREGLHSSVLHKIPDSLTKQQQQRSDNVKPKEGLRSSNLHQNTDSVIEEEAYNVKPNEELRSSILRKNPDSVAQERNNNVKHNEDNKDEDDKRFTKDMMQKYLKMVKPLYVRASKRYGDKMRFSGQLVSFSGGDNKASGGTMVVSGAPLSTAEVSGGGEVEAVVESVKSSSINSKSSGKSIKERNFTAGLRVVLGKSKSASAVPVEAPPVSKRRDDSLIEQQDGIQSAIMHCKRSFNASRESAAKVVGGGEKLKQRANSEN